MIIKEIYLNNFKSLVEFKLKLTSFNCLIGLNGAGKTTILQALDFLAQLISGKLNNWLEQRKWRASDLNCKLITKSNIHFKLTIDINGKNLVWEGAFNRVKLYCSHETFSLEKETLLKVDSGYYELNKKKHKITFDYQGSILSQLKTEILNNELCEFKQEFSCLNSLELLAPHLLRQSSRGEKSNIGIGGELLSVFLYHLTQDEKEKLLRHIQKYYPSIEDFSIHAMRYGWKSLLFKEEYTTNLIAARHISDGMLRIVTILSQLLTQKGFTLFDEIENGINSEVMEKLVGDLLNFSKDKQIMVTTHSPMILNYLDDEAAKESVILIYKNRAGYTQAASFFEIPKLAEKLKFMGAGEVYVDTYLSNLTDELEGQV